MGEDYKEKLRPYVEKYKAAEWFFGRHPYHNYITCGNCWCRSSEGSVLWK